MSAGDRRGRAGEGRSQAHPGEASQGKGGFARRVRSAWHRAPVMVAFAGYAAAYLVLATLGSFVAIWALMSAYETVRTPALEGHTLIHNGPYVYDPETGELVPATQLDVGGLYDTYVFLGFPNDMYADEDDLEGAATSEGAVGEVKVDYATVDMLAEDPALTLYDWGGNYTEEQLAAGGYDDSAIAVEDLAAYDAAQRAARVQTADSADAVDLGEEAVVSNVGYYVAQNDMAYDPPAAMLLRAAAVASPFALYGVLAVVFFRCFSRRRLAAPLAELRDAAERIAAQDLDFTVGDVEGRELGTLAEAFEQMRASLEEAEQSLWRTAEERKRLNAAFAHDLRTPLTVLKGTVEMARMKIAARARDDEESADARRGLEIIAAQVDRLERYADAMSRASRLEDRKLDPEPVSAEELQAVLAQDVEALCREAASASGKEIEGACVLEAPPAGAGQCEEERSGEDGPCAAGDAGPDAALSLDTAVVEEVVCNLVRNACAHAASAVSVRVRPCEGGVECVVEDDGPGFSAEALKRGCEPFYSENKSSEHFGMGLNIAYVLAALHGGDVELTNVCEPGARGGRVYARFMSKG